MKRIFLSSALVLLCSFSKNQNSTEQSHSKTLPFDSSLTYVYEESKNEENVATVGEMVVSWNELRSQDPALRQLEERYQEKALAFAYAFAAMELENKDEQGATVNLSLFAEDPQKGLKEVLKIMNVPFSDKIIVNFEKSENTLLAKVDAKELTQADFMNSHLSHSSLYRKVYSQRMQRLNGILVRRKILKASQEANLNMESFVQQKILGGDSTVTEAEVREFAKARGVSEDDLNEKMMDRLKAIIKQQGRDKKIEAYVSKNLLTEPVQVSFMAPQVNIKTPEMSANIPQWGKPGENHSLLYVGHWNCENCSSSVKSFLQARDQWGKKMKGAFIYSFPDRDRQARMEAEAGLCVFAQDPSYFWSFIDKILSLPAGDNLEATINAAAESTGADFKKFRQCFLKREYQQAVDTHLNYAKQMGVLKTPLMVINGRVLEAPVSAETLSESLKKLGLKSGGGSSLFARIGHFFSQLFQ
ncbi:MAG: DsbA family protein [Bdellovibrionales bacterium]|nr:DsbA family protein [Bdellovibrionales bacterium]